MLIIISWLHSLEAPLQASLHPPVSDSRSSRHGTPSSSCALFPPFLPISLPPFLLSFVPFFLLSLSHSSFFLAIKSPNLYINTHSRNYYTPVDTWVPTTDSWFLNQPLKWNIKVVTKLCIWFISGLWANGWEVLILFLILVGTVKVVFKNQIKLFFKIHGHREVEPRWRHE